MTVMPGAEPFHAEGGPSGVLLCHGFTGTPQSMRPWAEYLAAAGHTVALPRLPGHGTRWQDMQSVRWGDWYHEVDQAFGQLRSRCGEVFVCGLSMGGALALRLAENHPDDVAALVLVNPAVHSYRKDLALLPVLSKLIASRPGIGSDISAPSAAETGYSRTPLRGAHEMTKLWRVVRADLARVTAPTLLFRSRVDHVVDGRSSAVIQAGVRGAPVEERILERSFHVATLDHDAPVIFAESAEWMRQHSRLDQIGPVAAPGASQRKSHPPGEHDELPSSSVGEPAQSSDAAG